MYILGIPETSFRGRRTLMARSALIDSEFLFVLESFPKLETCTKLKNSINSFDQLEARNKETKHQGDVTHTHIHSWYFIRSIVEDFVGNVKNIVYCK